MNKQLIAIAIFLLVNAQIIMGADAKYFNKYFKFVRNDKGQITHVLSNYAPAKFDLKPIVNSIIEKIKFEQQAINSSGFAPVESFAFEADYALKGDKEEWNGHIGDALKKIRSLNANDLKEKIEKSPIMIDFKNKINDAFLMIAPNVVANLEDPKFFFKKRTTFKVVEFTLEQLAKRMTDVPMLNTLSYVVVKAEQFIREQRDFNQYMLMYYLENYSEKELGITKEEADYIMSSIYESRLSPFDFNASKIIAASWGTYGYDQLYAQVRNANNQLRFGAIPYKLGERVNYAFHEVFNEKGEKNIVNLFSTQHMFSQKFATAFNYSKPYQVFRTRFYVYLAQIGLSFVPKIPSFVKSGINKFLDSVYRGQGNIEGALYAHFLEQGNQKMANAIMMQNINPYLYMK